MTPPKSSQLIQAHFDRASGKQETDQLDRLLSTDTEVADQFVAQSMLDQLLVGYFTDKGDAQKLEQVLASAKQAMPPAPGVAKPAPNKESTPLKSLPLLTPPRTPLPGWIGRGWEFLNRQSVFSMVLALAFLFAGLTLLAILRKADSPTGPANAPGQAAPRFVAQVTGTRDARWDESDAYPVAFGSNLLAGQRVRLLDGLVEITWRCGTRMILEGPGDIVTVSESSVYLNERPTKVLVRDGTAGFSLTTASMEVIDLGTEFAVDQGPEVSAVHVFDGAVQVRPRQAADQAAERLEAGQAITFDTKSGRQLARAAADEESFVRALWPTTPSALSQPLPLQSAFDRDAEGWTASFDSQPLLYVREAGNPGGCVRGRDEGNSAYFYFLAPTRFLGDRGGLLGDTLRYDLLIRTDEPGAVRLERRVDVVLVGGGRQLGLTLDELPVPGKWTTLRARLAAEAGWYFLDHPDVPATDEDLLAALSDLRELRLRGEYVIGFDTADLDNVVLGETNAKTSLRSNE